MESISATEFKAKCLDILDHVPAEGLIITKRGKSVARIYPARIDMFRFYGSIPGLLINDDDELFSTGASWDPDDYSEVER